MEKKERSRKEWIKNILIIFLVIMLLLTFFSNTIMNRSLAEVSTQYITSGSISTSIKGNGTIQSVDPYSVTINEGRKIESVQVRRGQTVEKGDVLFVLEEGTSTELADAKKNYEDLVYEYERYIIENAVNKDVVTAAENNDSTVLNEKMDRLYSRAQTKKEKQDALSSIEDKINQYKLTAVNTSNEEAALAIVSEAAEIQDQIDSVVTAYNYLSPDEQEAQKDATINKIVELSAKRDGILAGLSKYGYTNVTDVKAAKTTIEKSISDKTKEYNTGLNNLQRERDNAEAALIQAESNYNELDKEIKDQKQLQSMLETIAKAEATYTRLSKKGSGNQIVAPVSGTIISVNVVAGETVYAGEELASIQMSGKDYILEMTVTKEQAARIHVGDVGKSANSWYYYDMNLVVSQIKPDTTNVKSGDKIIVFTVTGSDIMVGQSVQVTVGERSQNYDKVVPNTAIREDKNGTYILIITSKSTPLGNRYYATRVECTKIASDETNTAITCGIEGYESVITTATKPVADGDMVRLPD